MTSRTPRPYWNPYFAGFALGLVLLSAFVSMGRGLGISGAVTTTVVAGVAAVAPAHAEANPYAAAYLGDGRTGLFKDWLVIEVLGVLAGGLLSAVLAGRFRWKVEKGPRISARGRLMAAFGGGAVMGFATRVARGCTSGQALTGGAMLSVGSWVFMLAIFAGAYATAYFVRREWT
ncbi:MAG: YeeE/YedE thiosulfate transporter family protein [Gemmatimonadota bacterium]